MKQIASMLLGLVLLMGAAVFGFQQIDPPERSKDPELTKTRRVYVAEVGQTDVAIERRYAGFTRAGDRSAVGFMIGGRLLERTVEMGDALKKGDVIGRLDARQMRNNRNAAKASIAELNAHISQTERDLDRVQRLLERDAATEEEREKTAAALEALRSQKQAAEAQLAEANRVLGETVLRSPYDGMVVEVLAEPGEMVAGGAPIIMLSGDDAVEVEIEVPERMLRHVQVGETVDVDFPLAGLPSVTGMVTSVAASSGRPGRLFPVKVSLPPDPNLVPGMTVEVRFTYQQEGVLTVPVKSVVNPGGQRPSLFVFDDGKALRRTVTTGEISGDRVIVTGDITPGEQVLTSGHIGLLDGDPVEVVR